MSKSVPIGPRSALPQLLHMRDSYAYMHELARSYPDPFVCPMLGQEPMVLTWSPEYTKAVFSADPFTFKPNAAEALAVIVGKGSLFLKYGEEHKRTRKLLMPPFHGDRMRAYAKTMQNTTQRWIDRWNVGKTAPMLETAQGITLDIIIEAIFGVQQRERVEELHDGILAIVEAFNPLIATFRFMQREFGGFGPWAKFKKRGDALQAIMQTLIAEKRTTPGEDILSLLLSVRDEAGDALSEQEVLEQLLTFVVAGHETTATTLSWALFELHRNPEKLAKLREELTSGEGLSRSPEALAKLPYLLAVCNETLRMHPPVPIVPRKCLRELPFGEYTLPEGSTVGVAILLAHYREETFAQATQFRPERFLEKNFTPFEFMPFGGGARRCIGAAFATYELQIALGTILSRAQFKLEEPGPIATVFRIGTFGPETGVRLSRTS